MSSNSAALWLWSVLLLSVFNCYRSCTQVEPYGTILLDWPFGDGVNYQRNSHECWVIYSDGDPWSFNRITITVTMVDIEDSSGCRNDVLEIRDHDSSGPVLARICGKKACGHVTSTSDRLYLEFRSDMSYQADGFSANLEISNPSDWQYNDTSWQSAQCGDLEDTGGNHGFPWTGIIGFLLIAVLAVIAVVVVVHFCRRRGCASRSHPTPMQRYPPQQYRPGARQPYPPVAPQPYPPLAPHPYPQVTPQPHPGPYPVQPYNPVNPNPATTGPSTYPSGYWNPASPPSQ